MSVSCPECGKVLKDEHALQSHVSARHAKIERTVHKPKNTTKYVLGGAIVVVVLGILFMAFKPVPTYESLTEDGLHILGSGNISVIEYGDFECPACQQSFFQFKQISEAYDGRMTFEFRNFPLKNLHPFAQKAAEAAECAGDQGSFWVYHDELFNRAPQLPRGVLVDIARGLSLDVDSFTACLDSGVMAKRVDADYQLGLDDKLQATPTYFINGKKHEGVLSLATFRSFLE